MSQPKVKFDLQYKFGSIYDKDDEAAVLDILHKDAPTSGDACIAFEEAFAAYCGTKYARATSNGTASLFVSLVALGIGPGDRIITSPLTWIATAAAGVTLGADVDFVDIDPDTYNLDPAQLEKAITPQTRAILPVHLYGQCCDMDAIMAIAREHGIAVVEDACHTVGGEYKGRKAGSFGDTGCFSFHEQKNMSTLGEGGMIVTDDADLFERIALYRSHCTRVYGKSTKYCSLDESALPMGKRFWWQDFDDCGYNFRMTDIQAATGLVQLRKLDAMNNRRIAVAATLTEALQNISGLTLPAVRPECKHVFHAYPVQIDHKIFGLDKEEFVWRMLHDHGIKVGTHYIPLHWTTAFQKRGYAKGQFPVADAVADRIVTLPIHPRLTDEAVDYLVTAVRSLQTSK